MVSLNINQSRLLLAFYQESQKKHPDYINNISADILGMSWSEFGLSFKYLYQESLIWIYDELIPEIDAASHTHYKMLEDTYLSSYGKEVAIQLLDDGKRQLVKFDKQVSVR